MDRKLQKLQKLQQSTGVKMDLQQNNNKTTAEDNKNDTTYLTKPINNYHIETSNENHKKTIEINRNGTSTNQNRQQPTGGPTQQQKATTKTQLKALTNKNNQTSANATINHFQNKIKNIKTINTTISQTISVNK
jgi:hypothetical protein